METKKAPCNECPFRRKSLRGWLGDWKPEELLTAIAYNEFPCHQTIPVKRYKRCAGAAIYPNNNLKISRNSDMMMQQKELRGCGEELKKSIFANAKEFLDHHQRKW